MNMKNRFVVGLVLMFAFLSVGCPEAATFIYEDLGDLGGPQYGNDAFGINDAGQAVGDAYTSQQGDWPFVKDPGSPMQALPCNDPPDHWPGEAKAINSSGTIVGWVGNGGERNACRWTKPFSSYILEPLGFLDNGIASEALAINQSGRIVGWSWTSSGATRGFVKLPGLNMQALAPLPEFTTSIATGINTRGDICGVSSKPGENQACKWIFVLGGGYVPFGQGSLGFADSRANGLNDSGQIVGYARIGAGTKHAFLRPETGPMQDLGLLPGGIDSEAKAINNAGWIVGAASTDATASPAGVRAFLWTPERGMQDLNDLVVNLPLGVKLMTANAISNRNEIVGYAVDFNLSTRKPFRLKPAAYVPLSILID